MTRLELLEMIQNGENSGVEFKRDERRRRTFAEDFAKEVVALSNLKGGKILIGVEDNREITGVSSEKNEEWAMNICRTLVKPGVIPYYEEIEIDGKRVAVVHIDMGFSKPYYVQKGERRIYHIRVGTTSREATREELSRLFQSSGAYHYDIAPVATSSYEDIDKGEIHNYLKKYRQIDSEEFSDIELKNLLINADILKRTDYGEVPTVAGLLLFGKEPQRFLPQSGISFAYFIGKEVSSELLDRRTNSGTLPMLIEETVKTIQRNLKHPSTIKGLKRREKIIPKEVLREVVTNAVAHRDYSITGAEIRVYMFDDRIEVRSPGALPNTMTIEKMKVGSYPVHRNPLIAQYLRDLRFIDKLGRGIPMVLKKMKEAGFPSPELKEEEDEFILTLFLI